MTEAHLLKWVARLALAALIVLALLIRLPAGAGPEPLRQTVEEALRTFLPALAFFFLILQPFLLQVYYIPSSSMEPTLCGRHHGWRALANDRVLVLRCWYWRRPPGRADVVVFRLPSADGEQELIKRVVGLPGETVTLQGGRVWIDGVRWFEPSTIRPDSSLFGPVGVPPGHYLVLGDNRANSADSRWWGPLPAERILGRAVLICWPPWRIARLR